jgi:hypothetical protein
VSKASASRGAAREDSRSVHRSARSSELVPLERRLRRLRRLEAKRQRQFDRVHRRAEDTALEMSGLLAQINLWVEPSWSPAAAHGSVAAPFRPSGVRGLIGARAPTFRAWLESRNSGG